MSIDKVSAALQQNTNINAGQILFGGGDDFASKLTLGQTLKAKVLRHHEGGRYVAQFGKQEKIVDSNLPLKPGELIEGRVKAIGKQVELQRINHSPNRLSDLDGFKQADVIPSGLFSNQDKQLSAIKQFVSDHNGSLTSKDIQLLKSFLSRNTPINALMLSALSLKKSGVKLTKASIEGILTALSTSAAEQSSTSQSVSSLNTDFSSAQALSPQIQIIKQLAQDLSAYTQSFSNKLSAEMNSNQDNSSEGGSKNLASFRLLNLQDDSSIKHQLIHFPIWLGDQLIEINMAFFEQKSDSAQGETERPFKRFVFTLPLDRLGEVIASAEIYGRHVHLVLTSQDAKSSEYLSQFMSVLLENIEAMGWIIDKIDYQTEEDVPYEPAVAAVVHHYVSKNSISRTF